MIEYTEIFSRTGCIRALSKIIFVLAVILVSSVVHAQPGELILEYLPLYPGSSWTYQTSNGQEDTFSVTGISKIGTINVVSCDSTLSGKSEWVFLRNKVYKFKSLIKTDGKIAYTGGLLIVDLPLVIGTIWGSSFEKSGTEYVEIISKENIKTEAGLFKDTIKLGIRNPESPNYNAFIWLAKGVGIVKTLETEFLSTLKSYKYGKYDPEMINPVAPDLFLKNLVALDTAKDMQPHAEEVKTEISRVRTILGSITTPAGIFSIAGIAILFLFILILARISSFFKGEIDTLNLESKKNLADSYIQTGDFQKAAKLLSRFVRKNPDFPDALNALGKTYMGMEDFTKAIQHFEKALSINPDYFEAQVNLSKSLAASERTDDSIEILEKLIDKHKNYPDLHNLIACSLVDKNDLNKAKEHLLKALEINPSYEKAKETLEKVNILLKGEVND